MGVFIRHDLSFEISGHNLMFWALLRKIFGHRKLSRKGPPTHYKTVIDGRNRFLKCLYYFAPFWVHVGMCGSLCDILKQHRINHVYPKWVYFLVYFIKYICFQLTINNTWNVVQRSTETTILEFHGYDFQFTNYTFYCYKTNG
jgi:hypothetical protein